MSRKPTIRSRARLEHENAELRARLTEAEETLRAIGNGEVDALVVSGASGEQVFTLQGADRTYRMLIEDMREGALTLTPDGVISYANRCFGEMMRTPLEQVIGSTIHTWIAPADREIFQSLFQPGNQLTHRHAEVTLLAGDHTQVPGYIAVSVTRLDETQAVFCLVVIDLTAQKNNEAMVAAEKLARSILEQAAEAIVVCDEHGQIIRASKMAHALCDGNPLGQSLTCTFPLQLLDGSAFSLAECVSAGSPHRSEVKLVCRGRVFNLLVSASPLLDAHNERLGSVIAFIDITERKRADDALLELNATLEQRVANRTAELQAANRRLTELDHLKDEFLARIGHELRTPLTGILISLELLETAKPEKRERFMLRLKHSTERLRDMIEDVLTFSQLNHYTRPDLLSPVNLNDLIASRLEAWQKLSAGHDLQFQLELPPGLPRVHTDGELIGQAVNRLVTNAIHYTPGGSVTVSTASRAEGDQQWVMVSVQDTGPGITPDDLPHIFERFYRGRAAADYKTPGAGIGLSVSREIAEKLGGRLTVETQVGVGSTFTLWLRAV